MEPAFWDSSMLVPLCVRQVATPAAQRLSGQFNMVVSWLAPLEVKGAFARLLRLNKITSNQQVQALVRFAVYRAEWREVLPSEAMRQKAEDFVGRLPLRAALQLASAWIWTQGHPRGRRFISADSQLVDAARELGFEAIYPQ